MKSTTGMIMEKFNKHNNCKPIESESQFLGSQHVKPNIHFHSECVGCSNNAKKPENLKGKNIKNEDTEGSHTSEDRSSFKLGLEQQATCDPEISDVTEENQCHDKYSPEPNHLQERNDCSALDYHNTFINTSIETQSNNEEKNPQKCLEKQSELDDQYVHVFEEYEIEILKTFDVLKKFKVEIGETQMLECKDNNQELFSYLEDMKKRKKVICSENYDQMPLDEEVSMFLRESLKKYKIGFSRFIESNKTIEIYFEQHACAQINNFFQKKTFPHVILEPLQYKSIKPHLDHLKQDFGNFLLKERNAKLHLIGEHEHWDKFLSKIQQLQQAQSMTSEHPLSQQTLEKQGAAFESFPKKSTITMKNKKQIVILCDKLKWFDKLPCMHLDQGRSNLKNSLRITLSRYTEKSCKPYEELKSRINEYFEIAQQNKYLALAADFFWHDIHHLKWEKSYKILGKSFSENTGFFPRVIYILCPEIKDIFHELSRTLQEYLKEGRLIDEEFAHEVGIQVVKGEIAKFRCDALVNTTNKDLKLKKGTVSKSLLKYAGKEMQTNLEKMYKSSLSDRELALTDGYSLPCQYVLHGAIDQFEQTESTEGIEKMIKYCLLSGTFLNLGSIAFPALGTEHLKLSSEHVAETMFKAVKKFIRCYSDSSVKHIYFVIHPSDVNLMQAFEKEEKNQKQQIDAVSASFQDNMAYTNKRRGRFSSNQTYTATSGENQILGGDENKDNGVDTFHQNDLQQNQQALKNITAKVKKGYQEKLKGMGNFEKELYEKSGAKIVEIQSEMFVKGNLKEIDLAFQFFKDLLKKDTSKKK